MSLRARVLAGVALVAVVLGVAMAALTRTTEANLLGQIDAQLENAVSPVRVFRFFSRGPAPVTGDAPGEFGIAVGPPDDEVRRLTSLYIGFVEGNAVTTVVSPNLTGEDAPSPDIAAARAVEAAESGEPFTVDSIGSGPRYRVRADADPRTGTVVVLALPIDSVDTAVASLIRVELVGGLVIAFTLGLVAWWVIHLGIRPVKQMTAVATAIAGGDLSQRVPAADTRTEAGQLGTALNQMLGHIEAAFDERARVEDKLRQFIADASHELRTPVATIRGYAELYRSGGLEERPGLDDAMRRTEQEAERMGALVEELLLLARLDEGLPLAAEPVDLAELAEDAARDARAVAPDRTIEVTSEGGIIVTGDESRLRQVLANVVRNALVHTPSDAVVEIGVHRRGDHAVIEVVDDGPGMPEDVAARAFERFYRGDPARSRARGGTGLGLSIVEATVRAHGGTTNLQAVEGQGTTVRIELPVRTD